MRWNKEYRNIYMTRNDRTVKFFVKFVVHDSSNGIMSIFNPFSVEFNGARAC